MKPYDVLDAGFSRNSFDCSTQVKERTMPTCKHCGVKISLLGARNDKLCKACGEIADAEAKLEAEEKERQRLLEVERQAKEDIKTIISRMTDEEVIAYSFIAMNVQEKKSDGLGFWVGGALGGAMGAVIGSIFAPGSCKCSGTLGILVLTRSCLHFYKKDVPFVSIVANTTQEHLTLFRELALQEEFSVQSLDPTSTKLMQENSNSSIWILKNPSATYSFKQSAVYVNGVYWPTNSFSDFQDELSKLGNPIYAADFLNNLLAGVNILSDQQYSDIPPEERLCSQLFEEMYHHPNRDNLVNRLSLLCPLLKKDFVEELRDYANNAKHSRLISVFWAIVAIVGLLIILSPNLYDIVGIGIAGLILGFILMLVYRAHSKKARWCREVLASLDKTSTRL